MENSMNNDYKIISSSKDAKGIITHVVARPASSPEECQYVTVRGGLSWPVGDAPGYYIIFGQIHGGVTRFHTDDGHKKPVRFLREYADKDLTALFKRLSEDVVLLCCQGLYVEKSDELKGYEESLTSYWQTKKIEVRPYLEEASFVDNFQYGATIIKEWLSRKDLLLPEGSIIYSQLSSDGIRESDFSDSDVVPRFYAINALRHVITAFNFHNFGPVKPMRRGRRRDGRVV